MSDDGQIDPMRALQSDFLRINQRRGAQSEAADDHLTGPEQAAQSGQSTLRTGDRERRPEVDQMPRCVIVETRLKTARPLCIIVQR